MKYMGSKSRIAKSIVPIIQDYINKNDIRHYLEPFVGGANVIDKIQCPEKIGMDKNKYLIALLNRVKSGAPLLDSVSRETYSDCRSHQLDGAYEDWYVGNIGFLASYNGRWFDGGYAKQGWETTKNGERYRDYYQEAKSNIESQAEKIKGVEFVHKDFLTLNADDYKNWLIYCDPPYCGVKQYDNAKLFDYNAYWDLIRQLSRSNIVLCSEQNAPDDFECIWKQSVSRSIKAADKSRSEEKLYMYKYN